MVRCVEQRVGTIRAPHPVQWLSDNGSIFAAHRTVEIALALNLVPCFTPVESPESNGMAEAFVKTFKRDYVRVNPISDAAAALALVDTWMELQHRPPAFPTGLPVTPRVRSVPTRCVCGLMGSCVDGPRRARDFFAEVRSVGCRHVSGLFNAARMAAGPDAIR